MSLYYAPAFFGHLLGRCLRSHTPLTLFLQLGLTVVATFAAIWWPFLSSPGAALQVPIGAVCSCALGLVRFRV